MQKIITYLVMFIFSVTFSAQEKSEVKDSEMNSTQVKKVIEVFFEGLHQGDSILMGSTLNKEVKIQTTFTDKEGKMILKTESREKLLYSVANKNPDHKYLEKLLSYDIKIDGNLASVWTPYEFYLNGSFSHCGANSFQLFNDNGKWKIIYLVDMRRRESCEVLKEKK